LEIYGFLCGVMSHNCDSFLPMYCLARWLLGSILAFFCRRSASKYRPFLSSTREFSQDDFPKVMVSMNYIVLGDHWISRDLIDWAFVDFGMQRSFAMSGCDFMKVKFFIGCHLSSEPYVERNSLKVVNLVSHWEGRRLLTELDEIGVSRVSDLVLVFTKWTLFGHPCY